jgi:pSer/pThr/pTyr-binding forkhead associated (FHA) protein
MPRLLVKTPGGTKSVPLAYDAVTFGRTNDNTVPLDGEGVSRKHAQVMFVGKGYEVVDLGSRNGTKVNGQKVPRSMLKSGDVITIGGVEVVFEDGPASGAAPAGGLELEELDLGGAASAAPAPEKADVTTAFSAAGAPSGDCVLRFVAGEKQGTDLALSGPRTTFGRKSSNTVSFQDAAVSGVHAEITREANGYVLRDLGSTNGTQVDGEPVVETLLRHNARVRMGAQRAIFVDPTVADIESSLAADDPAEWGLMKGARSTSPPRGAAGGRAASSRPPSPSPRPAPPPGSRPRGARAPSPSPP